MLKSRRVGGAGIPGVMADKGRAASAEKSTADAFRKGKGGENADFDAAITSTF